MTEEIIINGVNVAGCSEFLKPDGCDDTDCASFQCDRNTNCYYKQLKRLEQENKELKAYKDVNEDFKKAWDELNKKYTEVLKLAKENADSNEYCLQELEQKYEQLRSALEEIREVLKFYADTWVDEKTYPNLHYDNTKAKEGLSKINECLGE